MALIIRQVLRKQEWAVEKPSLISLLPSARRSSNKQVLLRSRQLEPSAWLITSRTDMLGAVLGYVEVVFGFVENRRFGLWVVWITTDGGGVPMLGVDSLNVRHVG